MKSKTRLSEIHFYEWSISRWVTSTAHDELDALGRGIYREMIDACYAQGSITADKEILVRKCACTMAELEARWAILSKYFFADKHEKNRLRNKFADTFRRNYFQFLSAQKRKGKKGGRPKASDARELKTTGLKTENPNNRGRMKNEETEEETEEVRVIELDEQWTAFREAAKLAGGPAGSGEDWREARRFGWGPLDPLQRQAAIDGIRARVGTDDPALSALPKNYLLRRMWERPIRSKASAVDTARRNGAAAQAEAFSRLPPESLEPSGLSAEDVARLDAERLRGVFRT